MYTQERLAVLIAEYGLELVQPGIGSGGSAVVHQARVTETKPMLNKPPGYLVAIKEYKDTVLEIPTQLERIRQEAEIGKSISHQNLVAIHELLEPDGEPPLLIMQWVAGTQLDVWVRNHNEAITWDEFVLIVKGILDGLEALHQKGAKHRDLKPENIFMVGTKPVIMDMGIVEVTATNTHTLHTAMKDFLGSIRYSSPQFLSGEGFETSDDIYSLGATLYFVIKRTEIFSDIDRKTLLSHYILTSTPELGALPKELPTTLRVLVEGMLHRERRRRPSIAEIREYVDHPTEASYVKKELDARNREARGFQIIAVEDKGATVIADLRGETPYGRSFVVVRELQKVNVPSLGGEVKPEKWIADVVLKTHYRGVAHFAVQGKRWQPGTSPSFLSGSSSILGTPGKWVEYDKLSDTVQVGDLIISGD